MRTTEKKNFLIITILIIFIVKIFFKIFKLDFNFFLAFILILKFLEGYIISTPFGKWLKSVEEQIFNLEVFQSFLFTCMLLESFFFSAKEMKLGFFVRVKVFIMRTLWVCVTWQGFCLLSDDTLDTWHDINPLIIFFVTTLYLNIRSKVLNYQFLCVDNTFVSWSDIIKKLQILGDYRITNKLNGDSTFFLLSSKRNHDSFPKELNVSTLSSVKRTMVYDTVVKTVKSINAIEHFNKLWATVVASGIIGNTVFRHFYKQDSMQQQATEIIKTITPLEEKISQLSLNILERTHKIEILKIPQYTHNSLLLPFFKASREPKVEREIDLLEFELRQLYEKLVRTKLEVLANQTVISYSEEAQKFPLFKPELHQLAHNVIRFVNLDSLVDLFISNKVKFYELINLIAHKIIMEECSLKQLAIDSSIRPFIKLKSEDLIGEVIELTEDSSYEDSSAFTMLDYVD